MKKIIILFLLLFPLLALADDDPCQENVCLARMGAMIAGGGVAAAAPSCNYTTCSAGCKLFDWDASTAAMTSNVCSLGDTSATLVNEADLTTNAGKVTLTDATENGNDYYKFDIASYDVFPAGDVTIEFTINISALGNNAKAFIAYFDSNNYMNVVFPTGSGNDITVNHRGNGATAVTKTFDVNLSTSTDYSIVIKCGTNGMALSINGGSSYTTDATKTITTMTHSGTVAGGLKIGNEAASKLQATIDNIRISSGWRTDI
jgi:hypothetical protein